MVIEAVPRFKASDNPSLKGNKSSFEVISLLPEYVQTVFMSVESVIIASIPLTNEILSYKGGINHFAICASELI